jgi:hypothetical protein
MSDRQDQPDPRSQCVSNIEKNDPHRGWLQLTRLKILVYDGVYPDANLTSLYEISDPSVSDPLRPNRPANIEVNVTARSSFHVHLQRNDTR